MPGVGPRDKLNPRQTEEVDADRIAGRVMWRSCTLLLLTAAVLAGQQAGRREVPLIVTNATVITMDAASRVLAAGAVAVDGRDIVAVDSAAAIARQLPARDTIEAHGPGGVPRL